MAKKKRIRCRQCGEFIRITDGDLIALCPHCGCCNYDDNDGKHDKDLVSNDDLKNAYQVSQINQRYRFTLQRKLLFLLLTLTVIGGVFAFSHKFLISGLISAVQLFIGGYALYLGTHAVRMRHVVLRIVLTILAFAFIIPSSLSFAYYNKYGDTMKWDTFYLGEYAPELDGYSGQISLNSPKNLHLYIGFIDDSQMQDYVERCRDFGYTVEETLQELEFGQKFQAFNREGYSLKLTHFSSDEYLHLWVSAPIEVENQTWPEKMNGLLPRISMKHGRIDADNESYFGFYVGDIDHKAYTQYVDRVCRMGYTLKSERRENRFSGYNQDGYELRITYHGFHIMEIALIYPKT